MKAIYIERFGAPEDALSIREVEKLIPQEEEVLIQVQTFGLNYADVMARKGLYNDAPPVPFVPGYEVVGEIVEVGKEVSGLQKGDRVLAFTLFGAYAERAVAHKKAVVKLPKEIDNASATALATQYCTAWYAAVLRGNLLPGEKVLIHAAAGGVGTALIQIAKWRKCKIIGVAGSENKMTYLNQMGVDHSINYKEVDFEKEVMEKYGKVNAVFDPVGGKAFRKNFRLLDKGGRLMMYGVSEFSNAKGNLWDKLRLAARFGILHPIELLMHSKGIIGINMLHVAQQHPDIIAHCLSEVVEYARQGVLTPHVSESYQVGQLNDAHRSLASGSTIGKLVVNW